MSYNNTSQTRTFKIVEKCNFADEDMKWIGALAHVSVVTMHHNFIRVRTEFEDAVPAIVDSINKRYCTSAKPKLNPLFCVYTQPPIKRHKKY